MPHLDAITSAVTEHAAPVDSALGAPLRPAGIRSAERRQRTAPWRTWRAVAVPGRPHRTNRSCHGRFHRSRAQQVSTMISNSIRAGVCAGCADGENKLRSKVRRRATAWPSVPRGQERLAHLGLVCSMVSITAATITTAHIAYLRLQRVHNMRSALGSGARHCARRTHVLVRSAAPEVGAECAHRRRGAESAVSTRWQVGAMAPR